MRRGGMRRSMITKDLVPLRVLRLPPRLWRRPLWPARSACRARRAGAADRERASRAASAWASGRVRSWSCPPASSVLRDPVFLLETMPAARWLW